MFTAFRALRAEYADVVKAHNGLADRVNKLEAGATRLESVINYQQSEIERLQALAHRPVSIAPADNNPATTALSGTHRLCFTKPLWRSRFPFTFTGSNRRLGHRCQCTPSPTLVPMTTTSTGERKSIKIPGLEILNTDCCRCKTNQNPMPATFLQNHYI